MFGHFKYNQKQKEIIQNCISSNEEEYDKWYFHNLWYPIGVISLSIILFALVKQDFNLVIEHTLNGSISLLGINVLFAMSSYLIRIKSFEKDELKKDVLTLSNKLNDWKGVLIVLGTILYVLPIFYNSNSYFYKIILFVLTLTILFFSINISLKIFMIRDDFYQKTYKLEETFDKVIREETEEVHGKNW